MDKVKMIADAKLCQDGEWITPGKEFECSPEDAADLESKTMQMAHRAPTGAAAVAERIKRTYRRRDMTAQ